MPLVPGGFGQLSTLGSETLSPSSRWAVGLGDQHGASQPVCRSPPGPAARSTRTQRTLFSESPVGLTGRYINAGLFSLTTPGQEDRAWCTGSLLRAAHAAGAHGNQCPCTFCREFALQRPSCCVNGTASFTFDACFCNQKSTSGHFRITLFSFAVAEKKNVATSSILNLRSSHTRMVFYIVFSCLHTVRIAQH